jgi:hypothetical protein
MMMKVKGTELAGEYRASTIAATYDIDIDVARQLKERRVVDIDDADHLLADGVAEEVSDGFGG